MDPTGWHRIRGNHDRTQTTPPTAARRRGRERRPAVRARWWLGRWTLLLVLACLAVDDLGAQVPETLEADAGTYCGPLPQCGKGVGGSYGRYILGLDPPAMLLPRRWDRHDGNAAARERHRKSSEPLQVIDVVDSSGRPVVGAEVRFHALQRGGRGVVGKTDADGRFEVTVWRPATSHRFTVSHPGYSAAQLDLAGERIVSGRHRIVLEPEWIGDAAAPPPAVRRVAVFDRPVLPERDRRGLERARRALGNQRWDLAVEQLADLEQRWPVVELPDGRDPDLRHLLVTALLGAGELEAARSLERVRTEVVDPEPLDAP